MVQSFEKSIQKASQNHQGAAALPREVEEVREESRLAGQLGQDLGDPHLPVSVHRRFKIASHGHFHRVENHAQGEGGDAAG